MKLTEPEAGDSGKKDGAVRQEVVFSERLRLSQGRADMFHHTIVLTD